MVSEPRTHLQPGLGEPGWAGRLLGDLREALRMSLLPPACGPLPLSHSTPTPCPKGINSSSRKHYRPRWEPGGGSCPWTPGQHSPASRASGPHPTSRLLTPSAHPAPCAKDHPHSNRALRPEPWTGSQSFQPQSPCQGRQQLLRPCPARPRQSASTGGPQGPGGESEELEGFPGLLPRERESPSLSPLASGHQMPALGWSWAPGCCLQVAGAPGPGTTPSQPLLQPCSPVVLAGGALRGALGRGALREPLPLGAFAQPLEHGAKGRCQLRLGSAGAGGPSGVVGRRRVSSLAAQLGSGKVGQLGTGKAVSGRPLPAGEAASWGGQSRCACTHAHPLTPLLHNQFGRKGHSPEGGAPEAARLPGKVWTCYTHTPRGSQQ